MKKGKNEITIRSSAAEYLTYVASVGDQQDSIEMRYEDENIWLTQKMMATLYDVGLPTINEHIKKIYADSELEESSTIRNFRIVQTEGSRQVTRDTKHYNLQMIIAVGFKVNNERAVQFRKWANDIVKDYSESYANNHEIIEALKEMMDEDTENFLTSSPRYMMIFLDYLREHYGSAKAYLYHIGMSEEDIEDIKQSFII